MLANGAAAMLTQVDFVPVVLHLAAAGIDKTHERAAAAERAFVGERALHATGRFNHANRKRRAGQQLYHSVSRSSFKHKGHKVVLLIVERVRNVFALRCRDWKTARDLLGYTDDVVKLTVQLRGHADRQRLRPGSEDGERKRPLPGQLVAEGGGEHAREAALERPSAVIDFKHIRCLLTNQSIGL